MTSRDRLDEIVVTPEMIRAGTLAYLGFDPERDQASEMVKRVFVAMAEVLLAAPKDDRSPPEPSP